MAIRLSIEVTSPMTPDDRDLLSGIAVMTMAIANRELPVKEEEEEDKPIAAPISLCGFADPERDGQVCIGVLGHRGRHRFRPVPGLAN